MTYERKIDAGKLKAINALFEYTSEWYDKTHKLHWIDNVNSPEDLEADILLDGDNNLERFRGIKLEGRGLELGFSNGRSLYYISKKYPGVIMDGIDWMESLEKVIPFMDVLFGNIGHLFINGLDDFNCYDNTYDFITSLDVFEHLDNAVYHDCLDESYRVLKDDGFFFVYIGKPSSCSHINCKPDNVAIEEIKGHGFEFIMRKPDNNNGLLIFKKSVKENDK
jgi:cyclopropane fatty-acyl-phospholipid synthase-like methyltransferase